MSVTLNVGWSPKSFWLLPGSKIGACDQSINQSVYIHLVGIFLESGVCKLASNESKQTHQSFVEWQKGEPVDCRREPVEKVLEQL
jgi:hypothetical protein